MLGFRIHQLQRRVDKRWVEAFRSIPVANISDVMSRMASGGTELRPMHAGNVMAGLAFTEAVEAFERNLLVDALQRSGGNLTQASQELGMAKTTLFDKVKKYGLSH